MVDVIITWLRAVAASWQRAAVDCAAVCHRQVQCLVVSCRLAASRTNVAGSEFGGLYANNKPAVKCTVQMLAETSAGVSAIPERQWPAVAAPVTATVVAWLTWQPLSRHNALALSVSVFVSC